MDQEEGRTHYVIDTSSLVEISGRADVENVWQLIFKLITVGRMWTVVLVMEELERVDEDAYKRVKPHSKNLVVGDTAELLLEAGRISHLYRTMSRPLGKWNIADPYVLALAKINGHTVVTDEKLKRQKMPKVCARENIRCIKLADLIKAEIKK